MNLDTQGIKATRQSQNGSGRILAAAIIGILVLAVGPVCGQPFVTIISDGFGDGDLNGDGIPLETLDTHQGSFIPDVYGALNGPPDPETGDPTETGPRIPSLQQEVDAGTLVLDPTDTGITWLGASGFGSSGTSSPTARLRIVNDTTAAVPVDMSNPFSRFPETLGSAASPTPTVQADANAIHIPALDTGLALSHESSGSGTSSTGFLGQRVGLGDEVGDQLRFGFDFRIWGSAPNDADRPLEDPAAPTAGELRFGIYRDSAGHIGQTNPTAGSGGTPATFGTDPGFFRESSPGAGGAEGFFIEVPIGDVNNPAENLQFDAAGSSARVREDTVQPSQVLLNPITNEPIINPFTGEPEMTPGQRILTTTSGTGGDFTVAAGAPAVPDTPTGEQFAVIHNVDTHRVEFTLERALLTDTDPVTLEDIEFVGITTTLEVTNLQTGVTTSLSGADGLDRDNDGVLDGTTNFFVDEFDYVALLATGTSGGVQSADFDFIIDNFEVAISGSEVPSGLRCDADGGSECNLADLDALYAAFGTSVTANSGFDYNGDGSIDPADIAGWLADASVTANTANPMGLTYVVGDADLDGDVDSSDLGLLLNNFGANTVVSWNQGNLDGDGTVGSTDLGLLLNNFGSSSAANAVPEPNGGWMMLLAIGLITRAIRKNR